MSIVHRYKTIPLDEVASRISFYLGNRDIKGITTDNLEKLKNIVHTNSNLKLDCYGGKSTCGYVPTMISQKKFPGTDITHKQLMTSREMLSKYQGPIYKTKEQIKNKKENQTPIDTIIPSFVIKVNSNVEFNKEWIPKKRDLKDIQKQSDSENDNDFQFLK